MENSRQLGVVCACITLFATNVIAADKDWNCGDGAWDDASCWSPYGQPLHGDDIYLTQSDAIARTVTFSNTLYATATLNSLMINATGSGTMTLLQSQDSLASTTEYVGYDGTGTFTQTAGTNTVGDLYMGYLSTGNGTYNLSGTGSLVANNEVISRLGNGTFNQTGGTNTADYLAVAYCRDGADCSSNSGTYNMDAGNLSVVDMGVGVNYGKTIGSYNIGGAFAEGIFNQTGGNVTVSNVLYLTDIRSSSGTYNLSGGSLEAGEISAYNFDDTGVNTAVINQNGGSVITNRIMSIRSAFNYNLVDGNLTANTIDLFSYSEFNQSGGVNVVSNTLTLDERDYSYPGSHYALSGGTLDAGNIVIRGDSVFTQTGGINTVSGDIALVKSSRPPYYPPYYQTYGEYTLDGGVLTASSITVESGSIFNIHGGRLDAMNIVLNAGGNFNFDGGTLLVDNFTGDLVNDGGTIEPGTSPGMGL
jgi:hypothetical protein